MMHFGKAAERGSPEAYFYIGLGFLCMLMVLSGNTCGSCRAAYTYILNDMDYLLVDITTTMWQHKMSAKNFCALLVGLGKSRNPAKAANNLKIAAQAGKGLPCMVRNVYALFASAVAACLLAQDMCWPFFAWERWTPKGVADNETVRMQSRWDFVCNEHDGQVIHGSVSSSSCWSRCLNVESGPKCYVKPTRRTCQVILTLP